MQARATDLTECNVMTALCLWEAHLESLHLEGLDKMTANDRRDALAAREEIDDFWREREGAYGARQLMIDIAPVVDRVWDRHGDETDGITFDWEFCPAFLSAFQKLAKGADFADAYDACDTRNPAALALIDKAATFAITLCAINL